MRVLILGGSWFVGRATVEAALARQIDVTTFSRGRTGHPPGGVTALHGDRESMADLRRLASHGPWDVVIDIAGAVPAVANRSAQLLSDVAARSVFISSISAYRDWPHAPVDEMSPVWDGDPAFDPGTRVWDPEMYGPLKVGCERAWTGAFGDRRHLTIRPHVILGRYEYVGRLPWWLARAVRGGQILVPSPDRSIQPVDVRDVAQFVLDQVQAGGSGIFNVAAPPASCTYGRMVEACISTVGDNGYAQPKIVWVDEGWLTDEGVTQWTEIPLWRNASAPWQMDTRRAQVAGLRCRAIEETVNDTWRWLRCGGTPIDHERLAEHGIVPAKESDLVRRWLEDHPHVDVR